MSTTILLVDDDVLLCKTFELILTDMGFSVEMAHNGVEGLKKAYKLQPDVILLDVMMPDMDGWETCQRFKEMCDVPIIMLTAIDSQENVIKGLDLGADDYIVKTVTAEELGARIRAVLRRASRSNVSSGQQKPIITQDNLVIDFDKHEVTVDNERVDLSPTEFRLLSVLARHKGRVLPHDFLLTQVWGPEYIGEIDYLRLYISYLRRKLEKDPSNPSLIYNEWGVGYRFG
jgi:two-component system KDP operon response regulator KdpE